MRISILSLVLIVGLFSSCSKDKGDVDLTFKLTYGDEPLVMFQGYEYPNGQNIQFKRVSFYVSDVTLGEESLTDVEYVDLTDSHSSSATAADGLTYSFSDVPVGEYDNIQMLLGVSAEDNAKSPTDFDADNALSKSGEYWEAWESYIFYRIEGILDVDGDGSFDGADDIDVSLHIGADETARSITFLKPTSLEDGQIVTHTVSIDMKKVFEGDGSVYDMENGSFLRSMDHLPFMNDIMDRTLGAMSVQ